MGAREDEPIPFCVGTHHLVGTRRRTFAACLICFVREDKEMVHLYIFENPGDNGALPDMSAPRIEREGQWSFALWRDAGHTYALGATGSDAQATEILRALFRA